MKPFLHLSIRDHDEAALAEFDSLCEFTGLEPGQIVQLRVEQAPLPVIHADDYAGIIIGGGQFNASDEEKSALQQRVEADLGHIVDEALAQFGLIIEQRRRVGERRDPPDQREAIIHLVVVDVGACREEVRGVPALADAMVDGRD